MKEGGLNRNKAPLFIQYPMKNLLQKCHIKPWGEMTSISAADDFVPACPDCSARQTWQLPARATLCEGMISIKKQHDEPHCCRTSFCFPLNMIWLLYSSNINS